MDEYCWPDEEDKEQSEYSNHFHDEGTYEHVRNEVSITFERIILNLYSFIYLAQHFAQINLESSI